MLSYILVRLNCNTLKQHHHIATVDPFVSFATFLHCTLVRYLLFKTESFDDAKELLSAHTDHCYWLSGQPREKYCVHAHKYTSLINYVNYVASKDCFIKKPPSLTMVDILTTVFPPRKLGWERKDFVSTEKRNLIFNLRSYKEIGLSNRVIRS